MWEQCPLRTMRLPCLAAGDFFREFQDFANVCVAELLEKLPADASPQVQAECIQEFERGRAHLHFTMYLKLGSMTLPPSLLFATAHHDTAVARRAMRTCRASSSDHPRITELQAPGLSTEAQAFEDGDEELHALPELVIFVAELKWGYASERASEGGHASVKLRSGKARNRGEAFDSLSLRMGDIKREVHSIVYEASAGDHQDRSAARFIECLQRGRSPKALLRALCIDQHPSVRLAKNGWDPIFRKILYRNDPYSLYRAPRPPVTMIGPGPGPPGGAGDSAGTSGGLPGARPPWSTSGAGPALPPAGLASAVVLGPAAKAKVPREREMGRYIGRWLTTKGAITF